EGIAYGMCAGCARGRGRFVWTLSAKAHRDLPGSEVDDRRRNEEGRDLARTTFHQVGVLAFDDIEPTDARADVHADQFGVLGRDFKARHLHRFVCGGNGEVNKARHLARFFLLNKIQRVKVFDLCRDLTGVFRGIEVGDLVDTALAGEQVPPDFLGAVAERADQANACDDNPAHLLFTRLGVLANVVDGVLDGADLLRVLVGDFDLEGFLERHHQFDGVQRVGAKVVHEGGARGHFALIHSQLFDNDLLHFFVNGCHVAPRSDGLGTAGAKGNPNCWWELRSNGRANPKLQNGTEGQRYCLAIEITDRWSARLLSVDYR